MEQKSLTCAETVERLAAYTDRELSAQETQLVREHLATCACCSNAFRFEGSILRFVRKNLEAETMPAGLADRIFGALPRSDS